MKQCLLKRNARKGQKNMHTAGSRSFARIREQMINENPDREQPNSTQMFERTCKRTLGNEQMKNYQTLEDECAVVDPFVAVMGKEYDGHCRLYGKGITKKLINKVNGGETSNMVRGDPIESNKTSIKAEKKKLADMRKELEKDHERKKAELEAI